MSNLLLFAMLLIASVTAVYASHPGERRFVSKKPIMKMKNGVMVFYSNSNEDIDMTREADSNYDQSERGYCDSTLGCADMSDPSSGGMDDR